MEKIVSKQYCTRIPVIPQKLLKLRTFPFCHLSILIIGRLVVTSLMNNKRLELVHIDCEGWMET